MRSSWGWSTLAFWRVLIFFANEVIRLEVSFASAVRPASFSIVRCLTAAGRSMVAAMSAAVSASMFTITTYCSSITS